MSTRGLASTGVLGRMVFVMADDVSGVATFVFVLLCCVIS